MKGLRAKLNALSLADLGAGLRAMQVASTQRAVLDSIDVSLVLHDDTLINTATGEYRPLVHQEDSTFAETLASAARSLLGGRSPAPTLLLLLPPSHFVATHYQLNVSGEKLLRSALSLQAHTLLPAHDEPLLLGLAGNQGSGVALWYPVAAANALYQSFRAQDLLLGALMPRSLALLEEGDIPEPQVVEDSDATHRNHLCYQQGQLTACFTVSQRDLSQDVFQQQWQQETARAGGAPQRKAATREDWSALRRCIRPLRGYSFIPHQAETAGRKTIRRQQQRRAAVAAVAVVALLCLPFLNNALRKAWLERELDQYLELSSEARESQAAVIAMENQWGAVLEYPRQDLGSVLLILNTYIDSSLSTFSLNKGVVDITGFAQDPALLIEQLSQHEEFYGVNQSRSSADASSNLGARFGIRMNLSNVDFPGYETRYPPSPQPAP
ncbi:MAG TPA: hypothetical protein VNR18_09360 [Hyphomicrobiales bacterium]|nr:hypothetical protein [Hyphomicrobiales bacterium]